MLDPDTLEDLRHEARAEQIRQNRQRAQYLRHYHPRDPDHIDPDHQYTGQQPLDLD